MKQIGVWIDDDHESLLQAIIDERGQSITEIVKRGIRAQAESPWLNIERRGPLEEILRRGDRS